MSKDSNDPNNATIDPNRVYGVTDLENNDPKIRPIDATNEQFGFIDIKAGNPDKQPLQGDPSRQPGYAEVLNEIRKSNYDGPGVPPMVDAKSDAKLTGSALNATLDVGYRDPKTWEILHGFKIDTTFETFTQPGTLTPFTDVGNPRNTWDIGKITSTGKLQTVDISGFTMLDDTHKLSGGVKLEKIDQPGQTTTVNGKLENVKTGENVFGSGTLTQTATGGQQITAIEAGGAKTLGYNGSLGGKVGATFAADSGDVQTVGGQVSVRPSQNPNTFTGTFNLDYPKQQGTFGANVTSDSGTVVDGKLVTSLKTGEVQQVGGNLTTPIYGAPSKPEPGDKPELTKTGVVTGSFTYEPPKEKLTAQLGVQNLGTNLNANLVTQKGEVQQVGGNFSTPIYGPPKKDTPPGDKPELTKTGLVTGAFTYEPPKEKLSAQLGVQNLGTGFNAGLETQKGEVQKVSGEVFTKAGSGQIKLGIAAEPPKNETTASIAFTEKGPDGKTLATNIAASGTFKEGQLKAGSASLLFTDNPKSKEAITFDIGAAFDYRDPTKKTNSLNFGVSGKNGDSFDIKASNVSNEVAKTSATQVDVKVERPLSPGEKFNLGYGYQGSTQGGNETATHKVSVGYSNDKVNIQNPGSHSLEVSAFAQFGSQTAVGVEAKLTPNSNALDPKFKTSDTYFIGGDGGPRKLDYNLSPEGIAAKRQDELDPEGAAKRAQQRQEAKQGAFEAATAGLNEKDKALLQQSMKAVNDYNHNPNRKGDPLPVAETASSVMLRAKQEGLDDVGKIYLGNQVKGGPNLFIESGNGKVTHMNLLQAINTNEHTSLHNVAQLNQEQEKKAQTEPPKTIEHDGHRLPQTQR